MQRTSFGFRGAAWLTIGLLVASPWTAQARVRDAAATGGRREAVDEPGPERTDGDEALPAQPGAPVRATSADEPQSEANKAKPPTRPKVARGTASAPAVHVVNAKPDEDKGFLKLVQHMDSSAAHFGNTTVVTNRYKEICREPCGVAIDVSDRPQFYFMRDGQPVTGTFRLPRGADTLTLKVKPRRPGMLMGGLYLTAFLILPAGIPLLVAGAPRVWIAEGAPSPGQKFVRLRK